MTTGSRIVDVTVGAALMAVVTAIGGILWQLHLIGVIEFAANLCSGIVVSLGWLYVSSLDRRDRRQ
jgi:hypothetical protein